MRIDAGPLCKVCSSCKFLWTIDVHADIIETVFSGSSSLTQPRDHFYNIQCFSLQIRVCLHQPQLEGSVWLWGVIQRIEGLGGICYGFTKFSPEIRILFKRGTGPLALHLVPAAHCTILRTCLGWLGAHRVVLSQH